jgi:HNH endonuclease
MAIEITTPRQVAVTLSCNKKSQAFQVDIALQSFLVARGWTQLKTGKIYAIMMPPNGSKPPFIFNVDVPTREQVMAEAKEKHAAQTAWVGKLGEWIAIYLPPRHMTSTKVDPFTGENVSEPKSIGFTPASFHVGFRLFWDAEVLIQNEVFTYYESASQPTEPEMFNIISPEEISETTGLIEGAICRISVNSYERNPEARRRCIQIHGTKCCICNFDFGAVYGVEAQGYIHVHHVRPLSQVKGDYVVDPVNDLRPVCPNCHAVLHLNGRCRDIDDIKCLLAKNKGN